SRSKLRLLSGSESPAPAPEPASVRVCRWSLFAVYAWFGALKIAGQSPARDLVGALLSTILPAADPERFLILLGTIEVLIGVLLLVPAATRWALALVAAHVLAASLPLVVLPHFAWRGPFVPTLEGQYILKNVLIAAAAVAIGSHRRTASRQESEALEQP